MPVKKQHLIWIDLEMTGLDTQNDHIIEIATVVTDENLSIVAEGPVLAIHQPDEVMAAMDEWNTKQHSKSGLSKRVKETGMTAVEAERLTLAFLDKHVESGASPMCGNSICQDRRFLAREMPKLEAFFHYRNLDVSTLKELAKRWRPELADFAKSGKHLALDDIYDSINELKHYRDHFLRLP